jgi:putative exosortase-associated protein (TIGR04073 family)
MKRTAFVPLLLLAGLLMMPLAAYADQQPESIAGKMSVKFFRGLTNVVTSPVEIPKQISLTGKEMGGVGYFVVGPFKGVLMTLYRATIGVVETAFFTVPQPGYYDPTIDPAYVWEGWESKRDTSPIVTDNNK